MKADTRTTATSGQERGVKRFEKAIAVPFNAPSIGMVTAAGKWSANSDLLQGKACCLAGFARMKESEATFRTGTVR